MTFHSATEKNTFESVLMTESRTFYIEWRQKEYCTLMCIYAATAAKSGTDEPICRAAKNCRKRKDLWTQWRKERVGWIESVVWKYIYYHNVKQTANENLLYDAGAGWDGRRAGGSRERGCMYTYGWFMLMYGREQHNTVKQLSSN